MNMSTGPGANSPLSRRTGEVGRSATTILLVEDNVDNLMIYTTILEHQGFAVISADDGVRGLALARSARPDLILLDIALPSMDGWEITRTLKGDPTVASIPIIVLTAHALGADRARAFQEGADGYIAKPAEPMMVVEEIRRILANPQSDKR